VLATIREVERGATRVRIHRKACERRIEELEQSVQKQAADGRVWHDRARRLKHDRDRALECLRRFRAAEAIEADAREQLRKQQQLLESLHADERVIEEKLGELKRRRAQLCSREARTDAQSGLANLGDIDSVFDRWEARIEEREVATEARTAGKDGFARSLSEEEDQAALTADLERLLAEEDPHGD
jgi:hypothetical protein